MRITATDVIDGTMRLQTADGALIFCLRQKCRRICIGGKYSTEDRSERMELDVERLRSWIGRKETRSESLTPSPKERFNATFDRAGDISIGAVAPS
ncbi:hypothetical protein NXC14_PA00116 (plasmid) [Rhizobium sp. NXC14]|nr:hypothetical protein NXC14_PA00116 [Rhizobium sp. NXC14]